MSDKKKSKKRGVYKRVTLLEAKLDLLIDELKDVLVYNETALRVLAGVVHILTKEHFGESTEADVKALRKWLEAVNEDRQEKRQQDEVQEGSESSAEPADGAGQDQ